MSRPKLLLADDSVTIRKVVELTFADEGIDVTAVGDAQAAMEKFVDLQPDIVLVDVGLSGTNGYQICEMIKADDATKHIPVMLLVGSFEPFDGDEAHRVGADGFMTKPFNSIRDLVSRVSMLLEKNGSARHAAAETPAPAPEPLAEDPSEGDQDLPAAESDDIEELYRSSFTETGEPDEPAPIPTVDGEADLLGGLEMDDDMIHASYLSRPEDDTAESDLPAKEFDWSPEAMVAETEESARQPDKKELDPRDWLEDDDPVDQAVEPGEASSEDEIEQDLSTFETLEFSNAPAIVPVPLGLTDAPSEQDDLLDVFDDMRRTEPDIDPAIHETVPYDIGEQPPGPDALDLGKAIPAELVDEIVRRVVTRLSDSVVREIARVEVPRIAEKLMREALENEEKKA